MEVEDEEGTLEKRQSLTGLYRCNICDCQFDMVDELKEHFVNHPNNFNDKKFSCAHCQMRFKHKQNLMRHEVVHSGELCSLVRYKVYILILKLYNLTRYNWISFLYKLF